MKGVIVLALKELVCQRFGQEQWEKTLAQAGFEREPLILPISDFEDEAFFNLLQCLCQVLHIDSSTLFELFGDYWSRVFAPRMYRPYYNSCKNAREFLLKINDIHEATTRTIPNAHPPRFECHWEEDHRLVLTYHSERNLIDLAIGLIQGVGNYFGESLQVHKKGNNKLEILFLSHNS